LPYDAENRLTSVSGAASASFVYDGDGRRVKNTLSGVTVAYLLASLTSPRKRSNAGGKRASAVEQL